jgi:HlyD family secretion protein
MSAPYGIIIQIVDLSSVQQIIANVSETDIVTVQAGQPIQFHLKAYNERPFSGTVSAISPNGISGGGGITYPVITTIDPGDLDGTDMLPNMTASITITVLYDKHALRLPANAIDAANTGKDAKKVAVLVSSKQSSTALSQAMDMLKQLVKAQPGLINHKPFAAFVVERSEQGNTFIAKPVVLGLSDGTYYEVLQGLSENEHVIVGK